jgi:probable rRNA maturation factor
VTLSVSGRRAHPRLTAPLRSLVHATLGVVRRRAGEIGVVLTDDAEVRALNRRWRRLDRSTDVLSFGYDDDDAAARAAPVNGDVIVSMDRALEQARRFRVTPGRELARLVVHGTLHLAGLDHTTVAERRAMRAIESRVLRESRVTIAALDRGLGAPRRRRGGSRAAALALALLLGAGVARGAGAAERDWTHAFRGATKLTVARLVWSRMPTVAHRSPAAGDFVPTVTGALQGAERRKATDLMLGAGFRAGADSGAYCLSCLGEMAYAVETEPPSGVSALVLFNERRVLFFDAGDRVIGARPLGDDAAPLLETFQRAQHEKPPRPLPPAQDAGAPVASNPYLCVFVDRAPAPLEHPAADYPESMKGSNVEGRVVVRVLVAPDSTVRQARVVESTPFLDDVARATALRWRIAPARCGDRPVAVWMDLPFEFHAPR